jgi:hypothetical protein
MVAGKVIQKYQNACCEQLWQQKGAPKSPEEERVGKRGWLDAGHPE